MVLYIDRDSNRFVSEPKFKSAVTNINFKRGDSSTVELIFVSGSTALSATAGKQIIFGIKESGKYDGTYVVATSAFTTSGNSYIIKPSLNTVALNTLLASGDGNSSNDVSSVATMLEVTWSEDSGSTWFSTNTITATIDNDVCKGIEGTPQENPSPINWLATARPIYFGLSAGMYLKNSATDNVALRPDTITLSGTNNISIGNHAGIANGALADNNISLGYYAGSSNSVGDNNICIGDNAGAYMHGLDNILVGNQAGWYIGNSSPATNDNIVIGNGAGGGNQAMDVLMGSSVILGSGTASYITTSDSSIIVGFNAAGNASTSNNDVIIGNSALLTNYGIGGYNTVIGSGAGTFAGDVSHAVFIGNNAGYSANSSSGLASTYDICIGDGAGYDLGQGGSNILIGHNAGSITYGTSNISIGNGSAANNTSGNYNVSFGNNSNANTQGSYNTSIGEDAGRTNVTGTDNVNIGHRAGYNLTTTDNVTIGNAAGFNNAGASCIFIGASAGVNSGHTLATIIGAQAGLYSSARSSTMVGYQAGGGNVTGGSTNNCYVGLSAGYINTTGSNNNFFGGNAGVNIRTGSNNIAIGTSSGTSSTTLSTLSACIVIGNHAKATTSNQLVLGSTVAPLSVIAGGSLTTSLSGLKVLINGVIYTIPLLT